MKIKNLLLTLSYIVGICSVAFAQQQQTALNVATTNPSEPMNFAGNEQAHFVTNITNTGNDGSGIFIDNMQLQIPDGFDLVSLSVVKNETTLVSNSLSMQLNDTLRPSEFYTLDYYIRLTCDAIPTNLSNQFSVSFWNTLNINYTEHDTVKTLVKETDDFKLEVPSLSLSIGKSTVNTNNNVKDIIWYESVTDTFTIKNSDGAGSISAMHISMSLDNTDAFSNVIFIVGGQTIIPSHNNGIYSFDLTSIDFQRSGLGDMLVGGKDLKVIVSFVPTKFYLQTQATFQAQVKNNEDFCNTQINASAIRDYHCSAPNVNWTLTMDIQQRANYCGREFIGELTVTNISNDVRTNIIKNARLNFSENYFPYQLTSVQHNGIELIADANGEYPFPTTDIDGDGTSDLQPNESCTFLIKAVLLTPTDNTNFSVTANGETVDGNSITGRAFASGSLGINQFSLISPSDSKDGDSVTYIIDVDITPYHYFQPNCFMDVDYLGIVYDGDVVKEYEKTNSIISSDSIIIMASCVKPQLFQLMVKTAECDAFYIKQSKTGNSIVECPDSSFGNSCISVHTISVEPITPQEINTCETFTINATGEFAYLSNDTCSRPRRIIARVFDLDGNLQFEFTSCSISVNGSSYALQQSNENEVNNGIAWASDVMSFPNTGTLNIIPLQLTAELFIKGNHRLPNITNCNIRVEFAVEDNENIVHNANSKGSSLVVYDPQRIMQGLVNTYARVENTARIGFKTTKSAPSIVEHPFRLIHVELPAVDGFYYTNTSEVGQPYVEDIQDEFAYSSNDTTVWATFEKQVRALCITDGTPYDGTLHGTYTYTDYYASCDEEETFNDNFAFVNTLKAPVIEMNSSIEQGISRLTTWNVFVTNVGNADAPNVTLRIKPNDNNVTGLHIERILVNGILRPSVEYPALSGIHYVNIGDIAINNNKPVRVSVTMSGCTGEGTSYLDVTAIWTCEDILMKENIAEEFDIRNCNNFFTQLELQNMEAVLVAESRYPNNEEEFKLCQEIPIHLDIYNSGRANLTNIGLSFEQSDFEGISIENNIIHTNYQYDNIDIEYDTLGIIVEDIVNDIDTISFISQYILSSQQDKTAALPSRDSEDDIISVDFNLIAICDSTTVLKPFTFKVSALGNCGELQEKRFLYHLPLEGLDQIQMVGVTASSSPFTAIQSEGIAEGQITVTVTNNSLKPLDNLIVGVKLPDGLSVTTPSGSSHIKGFSLLTEQKSNGAIEATLTAPAGYVVPIGESHTFTLTVHENKPCPKLDSKALAYAEVPIEIGSDCGTGTCTVRAQTDCDTIELQRLRQPVIVNITGADTVCVGNEVILTASGANTYIWDDNTTSATISVAYPKTTYHVTGYVDECSDTEEHTITFVEHLTQPQLLLVVGADTVTNGKIQYSDWVTMGEQIIHAISDMEGTLAKISEPNDGKCGIYEYQYTISNQCDSLATSITFEVENCETTTCEDNDLVVIDGKPGYTLEDLEVLRGYVQNDATLQPASDGGYTITIQTNCGETTYTLNSCFFDNADMNKDGTINSADIEMLAHLILEHYKYK